MALSFKTLCVSGAVLALSPLAAQAWIPFSSYLCPPCDTTELQMCQENFKNAGLTMQTLMAGKDLEINRLRASLGEKTDEVAALKAASYGKDVLIASLQAECDAAQARADALSDRLQNLCSQATGNCSTAGNAAPVEEEETTEEEAGDENLDNIDTPSNQFDDEAIIEIPQGDENLAPDTFDADVVAFEGISTNDNDGEPVAEDASATTAAAAVDEADALQGLSSGEEII